MGFPGGSAVKNLPVMQEMQVQSLGQEDPLEEGMATIPVFLPGESHGQRRMAGYSPWGCKESDSSESTHTHTHIHTDTLTHTLYNINNITR